MSWRSYCLKWILRWLALLLFPSKPVSERQVRRCDMATLMLQTTGAWRIVCREPFVRPLPAETVTPGESAVASLNISRIWAVGQK